MALDPHRHAISVLPHPLRLQPLGGMALQWRSLRPGLPFHLVPDRPSTHASSQEKLAAYKQPQRVVEEGTDAEYRRNMFVVFVDLDEGLFW